MAGESLPWYRRVPWLKVLRIVGILSGFVIIALGIYSFASDSLDIQLVVANIYRILFGVLIIIAEFQYVKLLDWFSFLLTLIGLGGFYIFVGGLALGDEWYAITLAIILVCIGLVYCAAGMACNDDREKARDLKAGGTGASASSAGPPTEQSMVPKNNNNAAPRKAQWPEMAPEDEFDNGGAL